MSKGNKKDQTRRDFLKTMGLMGTASMIPGLGFSNLGQAQTAGTKNVTVFYYTDGGHSGIFSSADSFVGNNLYALRAGDVTRLGESNLVIDTDWLSKITAGPNQALVQV